MKKEIFRYVILVIFHSSSQLEMEECSQITFQMIHYYASIFLSEITKF